MPSQARSVAPGRCQILDLGNMYGIRLPVPSGVLPINGLMRHSAVQRHTARVWNPTPFATNLTSGHTRPNILRRRGRGGIGVVSSWILGKVSRRSHPGVAVRGPCKYAVRVAVPPERIRLPYR
jgi:hypothetical protein